MITTICLLILIYSIFKRPVGWLVKKLEDVDWISLTKEAWGKIVLYSKKLGRSTTRKVLRFYYVMSQGNLSSFEKAIVYAGILYITRYKAKNIGRVISIGRHPAVGLTPYLLYTDCCSICISLVDS